jgi:hypothetical protein
MVLSGNRPRRPSGLDLVFARGAGLSAKGNRDADQHTSRNDQARHFLRPSAKDSTWRGNSLRDAALRILPGIQLRTPKQNCHVSFM